MKLHIQQKKICPVKLNVEEKNNNPRHTKIGK